MSAMASQITGVSIAYSTVCSGANKRNHQSYASLAFVRGIHWWPGNSLHKGSVTRKMFPFDDVIMEYAKLSVMSCGNEADYFFGSIRFLRVYGAIVFHLWNFSLSSGWHIQVACGFVPVLGQSKVILDSLCKLTLSCCLQWFLTFVVVVVEVGLGVSFMVFQCRKRR